MPHDPILHLLGLAKKAGRLEIGEEPVGAACRARQARLVLVAGDAAPNTRRRCAHFGEAGNVLWLDVPFSKAELGACFSRTSCALLALTDAGFAAAVCGHLARRDPERYGPAAQQLREKADRALQRQREQRRHEKNLREGRRKPWAAPPPPGPKARSGGHGQSAGPPSPGPRSQKRRDDAGAASAGSRPSGSPRRPGPGGRRLSGKIPKN